MLDEKQAEAKSPKKALASASASASASAGGKATGAKDDKPPPFSRSAFSSSQPHMSEAQQKEYYLKTYPYNYLTLQDFKTTADSIERVYIIEQMTGHGSADGPKSRTMEAIVL